ncbi:MAG TPA: bifunctional phosphoribosylaminoimidazolecarboxamide formyltransferase/IMP cyclohydrolase [Myxococcota bacterium]|nr:bifunctional phosphoribosylaminoimidazolecarboxamide formyltransferase/IMP cyclohydrolase [Myxococcota bacterium]HQK51146.1 bifunctional phosphoribosylaminoimidazolecarboxamide formyltransferase/IMP cyclohydrolase [Myxococcota bacterium]
MRRAIVSVSDKTGVVEFCDGLVQAGFEVVSTGGTARALREAGVPVREVSEVTGFPECLDGRVKTLHPAVMGGILARGTPEDQTTLQQLGIGPVDLVAVNLYPFQATIARPDVTIEEAIEQIDIGGPSMIRAAAKNHARVTVVVDPGDYGAVLQEIRDLGDTTPETRRRLMVKVFTHTALYDAAVAGFFGGGQEGLPEVFLAGGRKAVDLRYGENPHQRAAVYLPDRPSGILGAMQRQGKVLSYNNLVDMEAAWQLVREFDGPAVAIIKHTNPSGAGVDRESLAQAYEKALATDPVSAFGGIVALNREVDEALARRLAEHFYEVVLAPRMSAGALEVLAARKNLRVMEMGDGFFDPLPRLVAKDLSGGLLVQETDPRADEVREGRVVTRRAPEEGEWAALEMAWKVCKHVKSNAIVFARADRTAAIGAGQMSRVDSARLAGVKAADRGVPLEGTAVGSDAFFPFPDGLEEVARLGATAVAQPGGSVKDAEVIAAADRLGIAMVFTGRRHFRH